MIPPQSSCQSKQQRAVPIYENTRRRARTEEQGATTAPSCAWRWAPWIRTPSRSWLRPPNPPTRSDPDAPLIERLDQDLGLEFGFRAPPAPSFSLPLLPVFLLCRVGRVEERERERGGICAVPLFSSRLDLLARFLSPKSLPPGFSLILFTFVSWFVYVGRLVYLCGLTMTVVWGFAGLTTIKPRIFL